MIKFNNLKFRFQLLTSITALLLVALLNSNIFTFDTLPEYHPQVSNENKKLINLLIKQFPGLKLSIWSTQILNEFMLHLPSNSFTILEVEKDALEPVFHYLQDKNKINVFFQPTEKEIALYINNKTNVVILKRLITKSPLQTIDSVTTVTLEKIIVDVFSEKKLFEAYQGSELLHIVNNAFKKYALNATTLLNYATRRSQRENIEGYLIQKTNLPNIIF
jgi:hypothetical protein